MATAPVAAAATAAAMAAISKLGTTYVTQIPVYLVQNPSNGCTYRFRVSIFIHIKALYTILHNMVQHSVSVPRNSIKKVPLLLPALNWAIFSGPGM